MASLFLSKLNETERKDLVAQLHAAQQGRCFICEKEIDLALHSKTVDVDHVEPSSQGGNDNLTNFALTHDSCNRSKQAADLRVARVLAKFASIREACAEQGRTPNLSDVLGAYGGAKHTLGLDVGDHEVRWSFGELADNSVHRAPVYTDKLSSLRYFFAELPIEYLHHDDRINPRSIGNNVASLVGEFFKGRPQLQVALAWVSTLDGPAQIKVFDGQHKTTAQVLLGTRALPMRVFVDPDLEVLLTTNTNAGTSLRQVAFDKSVQRRLGSSLFNERLERFRKDRGLDADDESFSEEELVKHFKGEREVKRYAIDAVRAAITHHPDNELIQFVEFGGKSTERPLSYSTIEKTFLSFFVYPNLLGTPLDHRVDDGENPRDLEIAQVVRLMSLIAEKIYIGEYDFEIGTGQLENKIQKGKLDVPDGHLRAFRMSKEEVMWAWLRYVKMIVQQHFLFQGQQVEEDRLFQRPFPQALWDNIGYFIVNLKKLPFWVDHTLGATAFGGRNTNDYWKTVFDTGKTPTGQQVLSTPVNFLEMMTPPASGS